MLVLADGLMSNTFSTLYTGTTRPSNGVFLLCRNIGTNVETVVFQLLYPSGKTTWIKQVLLYPGESVEFRGISLDLGDSIQSSATDSNMVSFTVFQDGFYNTYYYSYLTYSCIIYDTNGLPKVHPVLSALC